MLTEERRRRRRRNRTEEIHSRRLRLCKNDKHILHIRQVSAPGSSHEGKSQGCLDALLNTNTNSDISLKKSPGLDGLPLEFYIGFFFWFVCFCLCFCFVLFFGGGLM